MTKFFLALFLLFPTPVCSQYFDTSLDVPALTSGPVASSGSVISFDRRVTVNVIGGPGGMFYLYINTRTGDIGVMYGRPGEMGSPELNINEEKFRFMLIQSGGQVTSFMNSKQNGVLKHYRTTGNTEVFPVSFPRMERAELQRQAGTREPIRGWGVTARAYSANSAGAPVFYLHGRTDPATVTTQDFLGYSGIGYLKTDRGIYMAVDATLGPVRYNAVSWSSVRTELNFDQFQQTEQLIDDKMRTALNKQEVKLRNETFTGDCGGEEEELNRLKREDVEARRRTNSARSTSGNVYESDATRRAYGNLLMPNLEVMNQEVEVRLCKANARLSRTRSENARADLQRRIQCYSNQKLELNRLQLELDAIDARYPNDAGRAYAEKNRIMLRLMSLGSECR